MKSPNKVKTAISPTRTEDYPAWYQEVIKAADLAEVAPVRGCMTIKPWGYAIWERMQRILDDRLKTLGIKNVYFPLLIPVNFLEQEANHIEGFAKECAVVTHTRLIKNAQGKLEPSGLLENPYIIRPTSETIIGEAFARWIQSYRDLPLCINQWANVMRWEMRTRMFLRTSEFLWQEGHTAHSTSEEAKQQSLSILHLYADFIENSLAMPVIKGEKSAAERFPGAVNTYTVEAMMQDRKALQAGTSHYLGQNFSQAFQIKFLSAHDKEEFAYTSSWGVSTRLVGGMIMALSDDDGLVLPPAVAPLHVVILPILHKEEQRETILHYCAKVACLLKEISYRELPLRVEIDERHLSGGEKNWSWVKKGVPFRVEIGLKEQAANTVFVGRRDRAYKDRSLITLNEFLATIKNELDNMQTTLLNKARDFQIQHTTLIHSEKDFYDFFQGENTQGFALTHWSGAAFIEDQLKKDLAVTLRCIPLTEKKEAGKCIFTGDYSEQLVIFAKAY